MVYIKHSCTWGRRFSCLYLLLYTHKSQSHKILCHGFYSILVYSLILMGQQTGCKVHDPITMHGFWDLFRMHACIADQAASPFLLLSHDTHGENGDHYDNDHNEHHTTNCYWGCQSDHTNSSWLWGGSSWLWGGSSWLWDGSSWLWSYYSCMK